MSMIEFDGVQIDAELVRQKLAAHDAAKSAFYASNAAQVYVIARDHGGCYLSWVKSDPKHRHDCWHWTPTALRELREFIAELVVTESKRLERR